MQMTVRVFIHECRCPLYHEIQGSREIWSTLVSDAISRPNLLELPHEDIKKNETTLIHNVERAFVPYIEGFHFWYCYS